MLIVQQPAIVVILPVASTVQTNSIIATEPTKSDKAGSQSPILIRGTSTSGEAVIVEMIVTQKQFRYYGRFNHLGKPLQLIVQLITTERTSAGRSENTTLETVEELSLDQLVERIGGVENLRDLKLVPVDQSANLWQFTHQDQPYEAITLDLNLNRVISVVGNP